jgi:hypothetical protein
MKFSTSSGTITVEGGQALMFPSVAVVSCDFIENGIISISIMATLLIIQELIIALLKVNDIVSVIVVINNIKTEEGASPSSV